jgi:bloom syndrome protein
LQQIHAEEQAFDQSGWGDTDNEEEERSSDRAPGAQKDGAEPVVLSGDEEDEPVPKKRRSVGAAAEGDKGKGKEVPDRSSTGTPVEKCFKALKAVVKKVRLRKLVLEKQD